jgi:3-deoxy-D-manno-octulosonate 8-phosphate phosphatase (KDO 8-P phosphatase)
MQKIELIYDRLIQITTFIFDVDGIMTNGSVLGTEDGHFLRNFNIKDGFALQHAIKSNYIIAIISGGKSNSVITRFKQLGIQDIYIGQENKSQALNDIISKYSLKKEEILYMGDDMPDYQIMKSVGVKSCPKDAAIDVKSICDYISPYKAGDGCVRNILEMTLKLQNKWWNEHLHSW